MGTLRELVRRGLLLPEDPVALEGEDFRPAGEIDALMSTFDELVSASSSVDDPWRHWSEDSLDSGEWEGEEDHVLTSFLDAIAADPTPLRVPALRPEDLTSSPAVLTPLPDVEESELQGAGEPRSQDSDPHAFPGSLAAVAEDSVGSEDEEVAPDTAPPGAGKQDIDDGARDGSVNDLAVEVESTVAVSADSAQPTGQAGASSTEASAEEPLTLPVSFASWLEKTGSDDDRKWLKGFGRHDEGIVLKMPTPTVSSFSMSRVGTIILIGALVLGSYRFYIRTGALASYPTEDELGVPGLPDAAVVLPREPKPDAQESSSSGKLEDGNRLFRSKALRLRNRVVGNIVPFSNAQMMEDSLFKEFQNLGVRPVQIEVDALRVRGSKDRDDQRPVQADVVVELAGILDKDAERRLALVEERLLTTAFVLGKYATQGKVDLNRVRIEIREPTPWSETYEGRTLAGLWTGRILPENLFLSEK